MYNQGYYFPPLIEEIGKNKKYLKGKILNAGAGTVRKLDGLLDGTIINQDFMELEGIDLVCPLDKMPVRNNHFDSIICNAVLEHVPDPIPAIHELYRVLKPKGYLYLCIPFMQPEHLNPGDYQRYTKDGITKLVKDAGFKIIKCEGIASVYQTIGWVITEWLESEPRLLYKILKLISYPILRNRCKYSKTYVSSIATAYRVIAQKI